ncbi:MAG: hypothetical protein AB7F50_09965 [Fimbriimonadaceae bacterium]
MRSLAGRGGILNLDGRVGAVKTLGFAAETLGFAAKTLGDAAKTLGDAAKTLGDATKTLGDATKTLGDAAKTRGDATKFLRETVEPGRVPQGFQGTRTIRPVSPADLTQAMQLPPS